MVNQPTYNEMAEKMSLTLPNAILNLPHEPGIYEMKSNNVLAWSWMWVLQLVCEANFVRHKPQQGKIYASESKCCLLHFSLGRRELASKMEGGALGESVWTPRKHKTARSSDVIFERSHQSFYARRRFRQMNTEKLDRVKVITERRGRVRLWK